MAGETGRTDLVMDLAAVAAGPRRPRRKGKSSVYSRLEEAPGSFAFAQAVDILRRWLRARGVADADRALRFRVNPNLSFPPGDMEAVTFSGQDADTRVELTLNLMGLHGAASPLPAHFTEHVAQHQDEPDALRDFFDVFHQELISLLYGSWRKYRYYLQYEEGAADPLSGRFFGFIGMGYRELREARNLEWSRLLAYMGLIAFKGDAAGSLESTLRHYFRYPDVFVVQCVPRVVEIPEDQRCRLGVANTTLGDDCVIGTKMPDQTGKFRIVIANLTWERFNAFLPDTDIFAQLTTLVKSILRSRLQFDVELRLRPEEIHPVRLASDGETRLGWSTWIGTGCDGVVVFNPETREV